MGLCHQQAVVAGSETEVFVFETGFDQHGRRRPVVYSYVHSPALENLVFFNETLNLGL